MRREFKHDDDVWVWSYGRWHMNTFMWYEDEMYCAVIGARVRLIHVAQRNNETPPQPPPLPNLDTYMYFNQPYLDMEED